MPGTPFLRRRSIPSFSVIMEIRDGVIRALHAQGDALSQAVAAEMEGE